MEIIAKTTNGFLIQATEREVKAILDSTKVSYALKDIPIGTKLPGIDYAATIEGISKLRELYEYKEAMHKIQMFYEAAMKLKKTIDNATKISDLINNE